MGCREVLHRGLHPDWRAVAHSADKCSGLEETLRGVRRGGKVCVCAHHDGVNATILTTREWGEENTRVLRTILATFL